MESKGAQQQQAQKLLKTIRDKLGLTNNDIYWSSTDNGVNLELRTDPDEDDEEQRYSPIVSASWPKNQLGVKPKFLVWANGRSLNVDKYLPSEYKKTKSAGGVGYPDIWEDADN